MVDTRVWRSASALVAVHGSAVVWHGLRVGKHIDVDAVAIASPQVLHDVLPVGVAVARDVDTCNVELMRPMIHLPELVHGLEPRVCGCDRRDQTMVCEETASAEGG